MSNSKYNFQYCQKLIIFNCEWDKVLLARRKGEADYDGTYTFIGGKMETTDKNILDAMRREKDEEIGTNARVYVHENISRNILFRKNDGSSMIVPHYVAYFDGGEVELNSEEYADYKWVALSELDIFGPIIKNIPEFVEWALAIKKNLHVSDFTLLELR